MLIRFSIVLALSLAPLLSLLPARSWAREALQDPPPLASVVEPAQDMRAQHAWAQSRWVPRRWAQGTGDEPIFRRFSTPPRRSDSRLRLFEVPVALRPQTDADAEIEENVGLGYEIGFQPFNRAFASAGISIGRQEWRPTHPGVALVETKQMDLYQALNFWLGRTFIASVGLGLGVLDSLVLRENGTFEHNVVPTLPFRLGLGVVLGDKFFVTLRGVATPFLTEGYVAGHSRLLLGFGWSY